MSHQSAQSVTAAKTRRKPGFTLVELLVVIAIIGILVALLLPAIQAAREASRRMQCSNHLKQITMALHNYEDTYKVLPMGWPSRGSLQAEFAWTVYILPYLEQKALYDQLDVTGRRLRDVIADPTSRPLVQTPLPFYRCPSDTGAPLLQGGSSAAPNFFRVFNCDTCPGGFEPSASNYVGNAGFFDRNPPPNHSNNGVFWVNRSYTMADILDGTSNTFAVGERNDRCRGASWIGCRNPPGPDMWGSYYVRGRVSVKLNDPRPVGSSNTCTEGFSSYHPGGALFSMCDGSVRFIDESIQFSNGGVTVNNNNPALNVTQLGTYQLLGIRDDGQGIPSF